MYLYKYLSSEGGLRILANREITASRPSSFNDPFELILSMRDYDVDVDIFVRLHNPKFIYRLFQNETQQYRYRGNFDGFLAYLSANYDTYYANMRRALLGAQFKVKEWIQELADTFYGVFSTSIIENNPIMWAHYGAQHTGLVLSFDSSYFSDHGPYSIHYESSRPISSFSLYRDEGESEREILRLMKTKSMHWAYEQEQRVFFLPDECIEKECDDGKKRYLCSISLESINRVILGIRASHETEGRIRDILREQACEHIHVEKAFMDDNEYIIRTRRIDA